MMPTDNSIHDSVYSIDGLDCCCVYIENDEIRDLGFIVDYKIPDEIDKWFFIGLVQPLTWIQSFPRF